MKENYYYRSPNHPLAFDSGTLTHEIMCYGHGGSQAERWEEFPQKLMMKKAIVGRDQDRGRKNIGSQNYILAYRSLLSAFIC
jgi:hypothetical protein